MDVKTYDDAFSKHPIVVSTSKQEIDRKLGGGIPRGSLCLIEGGSDTGKSVMVQQFCYGALQDELRVTYYSTENTIRSLLTQMESLSLSVLDQMLLGMIQIYRVNMIPKSKNAASVLKALLSHYELQTSEIMILDSLTNLVMYSQPENLLEFFHQCKALCDSGKTIFITVHSLAFGRDIMTRISSLCDAHLSLRIGQTGGSTTKILEVSKVRGARDSTGNMVSFDVEPNLGMRVFPIGYARA